MAEQDAVNIGLSEEAHVALQRLHEGGIFNEMAQAYRFAIALTIARGEASPESTKFRSNWNIGTIDPDSSIRNVITELFPEAADRPYVFAQRLADAGIRELDNRYRSGQLQFADIFAEIADPTV